MGLNPSLWEDKRILVTALDASFAFGDLSWKPSFSQITAASQTARWYSNFLKGSPARELTQDKILLCKIDKW